MAVPENVARYLRVIQERYEEFLAKLNLFESAIILADDRVKKQSAASELAKSLSDLLRGWAKINLANFVVVVRSEAENLTSDITATQERSDECGGTTDSR